MAVHVPAVDALFVSDALTTGHVLGGEQRPQPAPFTLEPTTASRYVRTRLSRSDAFADEPSGRRHEIVRRAHYRAVLQSLCIRRIRSGKALKVDSSCRNHAASGTAQSRANPRRRAADWPPSPGDLTLIAHGGVHHDFPMEGVEWDTCTAERIYPPTHEFIENTVPSIRAAFETGASVVEIDVHVPCRPGGRGPAQSPGDRLVGAAMPESASRRTAKDVAQMQPPRSR